MKDIISITDYGARSDGSICTREIQAAINAAGNGTVHIPAGIFMTGTPDLHGASLHLDKNAVLKGSPDLADYTWNGYQHGENALAIIGEDHNIADVSLLNMSVSLKPSANKAVKGNKIDLSPGRQQACLPDDGRPYWLYLSETHGLTMNNIQVKPYKGIMPEIFRPACADRCLSDE